MRSDCCKAEVEPFLSFRMQDEGWYCTECEKECKLVESGGKLVEKKEGEDEVSKL